MFNTKPQTRLSDKRLFVILSNGHKKKAEVVTVWPEPVFSLTDFAPAIEVRDRNRVLISAGTLGLSVKEGSKEKKVGGL